MRTLLVSLSVLSTVIKQLQRPPLNCLMMRYTSEVLHTIGKQTTSDTVWYDRDCANARAGGCRGGAAPVNCHLNAALHCKDQAAISEMVEQEQWGAEGVQPPLNRSHYIRYNFNAGCSAGSAPFFVICRITPYLLLVVALPKQLQYPPFCFHSQPFYKLCRRPQPQCLLLINGRLYFVKSWFLHHKQPAGYE